VAQTHQQGRRLFIVRNGKFTVPWQLVSPSILPTARSIY
jgi:hypothetical protein